MSLADSYDLSRPLTALQPLTASSTASYDLSYNLSYGLSHGLSYGLSYDLFQASYGPLTSSTVSYDLSYGLLRPLTRSYRLLRGGQHLARSPPGRESVAT